MTQLSTDILMPSDRKAADQKYCFSCGTVLHFSATQCTACGAVQAGSVSAPYQAPSPTSPSSAGGGTSGLPQHHVYCRGCGQAVHESAAACPKCGAPQRNQNGLTFNGGTHNRTTAAILALLLGGLGLHKFYLGSILWGVIYLFFCWTFIPAVIAFIEGIYYLTLSDQEFARKYD